MNKLTVANEQVWLQIGNLSELMNDFDKAVHAYECALHHNPYSIKALTAIATIARRHEQYPKAVEYFQRVLGVESNNGEVWGAVGHCFLMVDELQKAYTAYQQALYHLPNPKDPNLWYGIGILYDRYGSLEHAEEAFTAVMKMDPQFERRDEIFFRLGIIYKQQHKYDDSIQCFRHILRNPPRPLTEGDIWFQIGHIFEILKEFHRAKDAYERVLKENAGHGKVLQQLGWLYHQNSQFGNQDVAITYLMRSIEADPNDAQTWYLLGRCHMAQQKYRKAYDAYQQAVYRDGRNPTFWCSIGVLYYQINQYRDALDAYSRAIRLNPYLQEVWYDLGTLYESCNQVSDALDAYQKAAELDPNNKHIQQRLAMLRTAQAGGGDKSASGMPQKRLPLKEVNDGIHYAPANPLAAGTHSATMSHSLGGAPPSASVLSEMQATITPILRRMDGDAPTRPVLPPPPPLPPLQERQDSLPASNLPGAPPPVHLPSIAEPTRLGGTATDAPTMSNAAAPTGPVGVMAVAEGDTKPEEEAGRRVESELGEDVKSLGSRAEEEKHDMEIAEEEEVREGEERKKTLDDYDGEEDEEVEEVEEEEDEEEEEEENEEDEE